jgi:hypothetical protein
MSTTATFLPCLARRPLSYWTCPKSLIFRVSLFHYLRPYCPLDELQISPLRLRVHAPFVQYRLTGFCRLAPIHTQWALFDFQSYPSGKNWWSTTPPLKISLVLHVPTLRERVGRSRRLSSWTQPRLHTHIFFILGGFCFLFAFRTAALSNPLLAFRFKAPTTPCYPIVDAARPTFHTQSNSAFAPRS